VYVIPDRSTRIARFDPTNLGITSFMGGEATEWFGCNNGVLGDDGDIYAANRFGQVLKVDAMSNNHTLIGSHLFRSRRRMWSSDHWS
jgi:hypothetical protein